MKRKDLKDIGVIVLLLALIVAVYAVWVFVVQWAWNTFAPVIGFGSIDFWGAAALAILLVAISGGTRVVSK